MIYISFSQDSVSNNNCFSFDLVIHEQTCGCCLKCCVRVNLLCCGYSGRNMASEAEPFEIKPEDNSNGITDHSHEDKPGPHTAGGERSTVKESLNDNRGRKAVYPCTDCEKRFLSRDSLRHHMISHRGKYKCTECGKCFQHSKGLEDHTRIHTGEKPFQCAVCDKRFTTSHSVVVHSRIHSGEKPYSCHVCGKAFCAAGELTRHIKVHTGHKPYNCQVCNKAFSSATCRNRHMRVHTGEKPYQCSVCGRAFAEASHLAKHRRIHSGEKPYICYVCGKAVRRSGDLQTHMKVHTGQKPYKCSVCDKAFSMSGSLVRHMRVHMGDKEYKCTLCGKCFNDPSNLQRHQRRIHKTTQNHVKDLTVESASRQMASWTCSHCRCCKAALMETLFIVFHNSRTDTSTKVIQWRYLVYMTLVRRNSPANKNSRNTFSDTKPWSHIFALNAQLHTFLIETVFLWSTL